MGEGGGVRQLCLHSVTQPYTTWPMWREQGGGLCSLPLDYIGWRAGPTTLYVIVGFIHQTWTKNLPTAVELGLRQDNPGFSDNFKFLVMTPVVQALDKKTTEKYLNSDLSLCLNCISCNANRGL